MHATSLDEWILKTNVEEENEEGENWKGRKEPKMVLFLLFQR
jgi:hypothetical protein